MGILNTEINELLGKKNNDEKNSGLNQVDLSLIDSAPVESMLYDLDPNKKPETQKKPVEKIGENLELKQANPFTQEKYINKIQRKNTDIIFDKPSGELKPISESLKEKNPFPIQENPSAEIFEENFSSETSKTNEATIIEEAEKKPLFPSNSKDFSVSEGTDSFQNKKSGKIKKVLSFLMSILIIIFLAGCLFYFLIFKNFSFFQNTNDSSESEVEIEFITQPEEKETNPKYLNLDLQNPTLALEEFKKTINNFIRNNEGQITEYVISDNQNNPISFQELSLKTGTTLPNSVSSLIEKDFRFFLYDDNGNPGVGIILTSLNDIQLEKELLNTEPDLLRYLKPIFSMTQATLEEGEISFNESEYKGLKNRYFNIQSPRELSIDYIISENKLFVGTTLMTIRAVYDFYQNEKNSASLQATESLFSE